MYSTSEITLLSVPQVARFLGCSPRTVKRRIQAGEIPAFEVCTGEGAQRLRVRKDELLAWVESRRVTR